MSHFLQTYLDRFSRERLRLYLFEDFTTDPVGVMRDIFAFLDVDPAFTPDMRHRYNSSGGTIRNAALRSAWSRTAPLRTRARRYVPRALRDRAFTLVTRNLEPVTLDPELRAELTALYREDIERLATLLDRDLSHWLNQHGQSATAERSA